MSLVDQRYRYTYEGLLEREDRKSPGDYVVLPPLEYDDLPQKRVDKERKGSLRANINRLNLNSSTQ